LEPRLWRGILNATRKKKNIYIYIEKHGGKQPTNFEDNTTKNIHEITGSNRQKQISPSVLLKWDIQSNLSLKDNRRQTVMAR
jgi:hypothetical protein